MRTAVVASARHGQDYCGRQRNLAIAAIIAALAMLWSGADRRGAALAQTSPIVANGNAVVTGFSGAQPPAVIAPGTDPADKTFIDLQGPSARVVDLQAPGAPPQAQLLAAPKPFTATAGQIGQVFGVALDNAAQPNVFVAATSVYGLPIVVPGSGGQPDRAKQGAPNDGFMPGLFGPTQLGGGPGSIWRIDGATGEVRLFANVALDGAPNPGPALGGIAFDSASSMLFVADRATGMIHAFDSAGKESGRYDHGVQGRGAAGLPPVAYDPAGSLDISAAKFRPGDPATWGYAASPRLIFGLGVRNGRLYYAVAGDRQIWSVSIAPQFGADPRLELSVAPGPGPSEIARIAFDDQGRMLLAERAAPSGAFDFKALTVEATGRVLRYLPVRPGTAGPRWQPQADEYAIGFARQMRNGNGGVAIGFGYDEQGRIDRAACGGFLWSTGEQLRKAIDPELAAMLAQSGPAEVNGLQGNDIAAVVPANTPPLQSYFIDYDDRFGDPDVRGRIGDIAIRRNCGQAGYALPAWFRPNVELLPGFFWYGQHGKKPPMLDCPPGSGNQCACPPGTTQQPGFQCCPMGQYLAANGQCKSLCPDGSVDPASIELCWGGYNPHPANLNDPSTWTCLDGSIPDANFQCPKTKLPVCPAGFEPDPSSPFGCKATPAQNLCFGGNDWQQVGLDGKCHALCPSGSWAFAANQCCPNGTVPGPDGKCDKPKLPGCPPGQLTSKGICCDAGFKPQPDGTCFAIKKCPQGQISSNGTCCPQGTKPQPNGSCSPLKMECKVEQATPNGTCCPPGTKPQADNTCGQQTLGCPPGMTTNPQTGQCCAPQSAVAGVAAACTCPQGQFMVDGKCDSNAPPLKGSSACFAGYVQLPSGSCCLAAQATAGGQCCPAGQKPDADKRKCVPAGGATFVPLTPQAPVILPGGKRGPRVVVPPPPPRIVVTPPKRFGPPKRYVPRPIIRQPAQRFRRQIER